jgi:formate dehydrogenase subunit beta
MSKALKINKGVEESILYLLNQLLKSGKISGVFALNRLSENKSGSSISYSLITSTDALANVTALYPIMPRNAGGLVSFLTQKGAVPKPVAVVIRPCEARALIELVKRNRGNLENLFIISSTCGGVFPTKMTVNGGLANDVPSYWKALNNDETPQGLRRACLSCSEFVPYNADMTVIVAGGKDLDKQGQIFLNSEKAEELVGDIKLDGKITDQDLPTESLDAIRSTREAHKKGQFEEMGVGSLELKGMVDIFGKCIGCRGCRTACPICYCELCTFETEKAQSKLSITELNRKGGLRMPPGTLYFHMIRIPHVSISCVGCGSCEDACPMDIPLSTIFRKVGEDVQGVFEYLPGKDIEEEIPIKTFELDEYTEVED